MHWPWTMIDSRSEHGHIKLLRRIRRRLYPTRRLLEVLEHRRRRRPRPVTAVSHILEYERQLFDIVPCALHVGVVRYASRAQLVLIVRYTHAKYE
jgi:hypothetical protein